ncbi:TetR/AcrR family transcriptional regulator [Diaminobutyricibacter sp. McL0608]|uniref:TetR/AcrR family transcriptional regulator n=1 Tax=Leifsonia sp. McL0608 TaxID=3143537 RepID=UPI0031F305D2
MAVKRDQRADARRNVSAILDSAQRCLSSDPQATIAQIAETAGVGRMTLYGHFKTRAELVEAVLERVTTQSSEVLDSVDLSGDPAEALTRLVGATWEVVHRFNAVREAARDELPEKSMLDNHTAHFRRLDALVARGQAAGTFRRDLPREWLISVCYRLMHGAADDCAAGSIERQDAGRLVAATLIAAYTAPGARVAGIESAAAAR